MMGAEVSGTGAHGETAGTAILTFDTNLKKRATYVATVTTGVEELAGNALSQVPNTAGNQSMVWSFRVKR